VLEFSHLSIVTFGLVLARVGGLFVSAPVFSARQIPNQTKIGLAVMVALVVTPLQMEHARAVPPGVLAFGVLAGRELLIGLAIGFAIALVFAGIQMGSQLIGIQMGVGLGGVLNPMSGADSSTIDGFYMVLATLIFLLANGHHAALASLARTFDLAPVGEATLPLVNPQQVMALVQAVFVVAIRVALPAIAALLLTDVALGLAGRAAPQMQVMVVGMPVKMAVGLAFMALSTPTSAMLMDAVFRGLGRSVTAPLGG
jgi:flagellar biosynthetic protein FliR